MNEVIREFLLETHENLAHLDVDLVSLEKDPAEKETIARVFRTLHTVKGTAGFLGLPKLQSVAHAAENLLTRLRAGELSFNPEIASALLGCVDAVRRMLDSLEKVGTEGDGDYTEIIALLERLRHSSVSMPALPKSVASVAPPVVPLPPSPLIVVQPPPPPPPPPPPVSPVVREPLVTPPSLPVAATSLVLPSREAASGLVSAETTEPRQQAVSDSAIRVDVGLLDKLMTLVGELVLARNQILQFSSTQADPAFLGTVQRLNLLTTELQAGVMKTRMQPIGNVWGKFPRVVRDLAVACGKQVRVEMDGKDTELDKTIAEAIRDPLTHMVRNAVDHGIETPAARLVKGKPAEGRLSLHASHEGGKVIIRIADDGGGIDPNRVRDKALRLNLITPDQAERMTDRDITNLIFLPGFSTAEQVTNFSGRGVGMDVVKTNVEKIGGTVDIDSQLGIGTTLKMKIPLTLAIIPALTITSGGDRYANPQVNLLELVRLDGENARKGVERIHGIPVYRLRGNLLPLVYLNRILKVESPAGTVDTDVVNIVVLQADDRQFGLVVDAIHDTEEIVVKPLQKQIKSIPSFAGATIMGDGKVALILDVLGLAQMGKVVSASRERGIADKSTATAAVGPDKQTLLLFSGKTGSRMAVPLSMVARLEEFPRSAIERVGNQDVVQYRDDMRLSTRSGIRVHEATAGEVLQPGHAWVVPGDYHMTLERTGGQVRTALNQNPQENSCRPAVDVLFRSVATAYGANILAVVLTGMGQDGLRGCEAIRATGGKFWPRMKPPRSSGGCPATSPGPGSPTA